MSTGDQDYKEIKAGADALAAVSAEAAPVETESNPTVESIRSIKVAPGETLIIAIKSDDMDESHLNNMRRQLKQEFGNRILVMCHGSDSDISFATAPPPPEAPQTLNLRISGSEVYKALKNYVKGNEQLHAVVAETVKRLVDSGAVKLQLEKIVNDHYAGYSGKRVMDDLVKTVVTDQVKKTINDQIQTQVNSVLERAVFVMPPKTT